MRLIYLEDDLIDQRLFKRACRDIKDLEVTYYTSCKGLKEEYLNSYDGIIIDQYLQDCSIKEFADKHIHIPMAALSASEILVAEHDYNVGIWQKPIKEDALKDIIKKMQAAGKEKNNNLSLEYINELTQGDEAEKMDLLQSIYKSIHEHNEQLDKAGSLSNADLQQLLHKQKSKVGIFYLEELHQLIDHAENDLKNGADKSTVLPKVTTITSQTAELLKELKSLLN